MRLRPSSISVTPLMLITACGITGVDMRFPKARPIRIRWKGTTPNCATTWRVWQDRRDASRVVPMRLNVPCVCLSIATTGANSISSFTRLMHWSFIDGPITANNPMGVHHAWGRTYKDLYQRFRPCRATTALPERLRLPGPVGRGLKSRRRWASPPSATSRITAWPSSSTVQAARAALRRRPDRAVDPPGLLDGLERPGQLRFLATSWMEDPNQVITVDGPQGPVTGTVEQIVGRLGLPELGGSYFTFSNENNYMIWTFLKKCWERAGCTGRRRHALVPALRHRHQPARDRHRRLRGADPHLVYVRFPLLDELASSGWTPRPACPRRCWCGPPPPGR
jgi:hypothetical protein